MVHSPSCTSIVYAPSSILLLPLLLVLLCLGQGQLDGPGGFNFQDTERPPTVTWLSPPKGHVAGGTMVTITGTGFRRSPRLTIRFAVEGEIDEMPATWVSESQVICETPRRNTVHTAQVTASNDGVSYSGYPFVYTLGSGTFLKFIFDNSDPGCLDCQQGVRGLNPTSIREVWTVDNSTGPYIGGTLVTITAKGLQTPGTLRGGAGGIQRYSGPVGGSGTPNPFNVDPMASGNGPPISGTFYPGRYLACQWVCSLDMNGDAIPDLNVTSPWLAATWLGYTRIVCESPPMPVPGVPGSDIIPNACTIKVTNNLRTVDAVAGVGFTYEDKPPTVTNIKTAQYSVWPARGPFTGNMEVVVTGTGFLPSKYLACKFGGHTSNGQYDAWDNSHIVGEKGGRARYISSTQILCVAPSYGPASLAWHFPGAIGSGAILHSVVNPTSGTVTAVNVISGGLNYRSAPVLSLEGGGGCCAAANATLNNGSITSVFVTAGGVNYGAGTGAAAVALLSTGSTPVVSQVNITSGGSGYLWPPAVVFTGGTFTVGSPHKQPVGVAVLGTGSAAGTVIRVDLVDGGAYFSSAPTLTFVPGVPIVRVIPAELINRVRNDPAQVGYYSGQGKGQNEQEPALGPYSPDEFIVGPDTSSRYPAGIGSTEDQGPLLPPVGLAYQDGSILKPGHLALVRVSNNYNLYGADKLNDPLAPTTHVGERNVTDGTGYWIWSSSGLTQSDVDLCRVSLNPPIHQFGSMQGHVLDARPGLGTISDLPDNVGDNSGFFYVDGSSVSGGPGGGAAAVAILSSAGDGLPPGSIGGVNVTAPGAGYNTPPKVVFTGGGGFGARAAAFLSGGTVTYIYVDPNARGQGYTTAPNVRIVDAQMAAWTPDAAASWGSFQIGSSMPDTVGQNNWNLDESARSAAGGATNMDVGHGWDSTSYGNANQGNPKKDCIYLLYSDIYVSPSGSDLNGQGTAGRPYRTIQKCIDAALTGARAYYVYKRRDGGDPDPRVPSGAPRFRIESPGERVDVTASPQRNSGTPWNRGYSGREVRVTTGRAAQRPYGQNPQGETRGLGYFINRDRCVLKDGVYTGPGNMNLHPRGRVVQLWAENKWQATIDCNNQPLAMVPLNGSPSGDPNLVVATGSVTMQGVSTRRCGVLPWVQNNQSPYCTGGYHPRQFFGTVRSNGQLCTPASAGCQSQRTPDGMAPG